MKKEITLEMIEAQLAVIFQKLSEMEDRETDSFLICGDKPMYYLEKLRSEAEIVIKSQNLKGK